jgi:D-sedoheptulose 7-phosphate isomerase
MSSFAQRYVDESVEILRALDLEEVERLVAGVAAVRAAGGRLFVLGVGGSAAHASHVVNDLRKICQLESYAPTDNVAELTARVNDDGWSTCFEEWLKGSRLGAADGVLVLSVGGGDQARNVSPNLVRALEHARRIGAAIFGVVGKDGGTTRQLASACVVVPPRFAERVTPHTEGLCSVVLHLVVSHPALKRAQTKWEATDPAAAR